ncbi:MAG TPA: ion channel [Thermoanaerobaculia bacterium]|nr:ion channel [Thermoanaerobaculia bacterium]
MQSLKLLPTTVVGIIAVVVFIFRSDRPFAAAGLLMLSVAIGFVMHRLKPDSRLRSELACCEYAKAVLLIVYAVLIPSELTRVAAWFLSGFSFVAALCITLMIAILAVQALRNVPSDTATSLTELRNDNALALLALVLAFLYVTYFLSLALGFTDRFAQRDLWAIDFSPSKKDIFHSATQSGEPKMKPLCVGDEKPVRRFFFVQSAATMACTVAACSRADSSKELQEMICASGAPRRRDAFKKLALAECGKTADAMQLRAAAWNARELYELREVFHKFARAGGSNSHLIEICGHANDAKLSGSPLSGYGSNLEISKQRAEQVERLLQSEFRKAVAGVPEPSVRWLAYGVSNEESFLNGAVDPDAEGLDQKLSVEVFVQPIAVPYIDGKLNETQAEMTNATRMLAASNTPRDLQLIDYLYFTIYTITTTGYGDIVPVSDWAKFLVSMANLIELLFVVVLVNVIANVRPLSTGGAAGDEHANRS